MDYVEMCESLGAVDAQATNADDERYYWHEAYRHAPSYIKGYVYEDFVPAYRSGYLLRLRHPDLAWAEAEAELSNLWDSEKGVSRLCWDDARAAVHAAWVHVGHAASRERTRHMAH